MLDPNDPRYEGVLNERRTILQEPLQKEIKDRWLEERVREFLESDSLISEEPKPTYAESEPFFWSAFLRYVSGTQIKPDTKEKLALRFYSNRKIQQELHFMQSRGEDIADVLHKCVQEMKGKFVLIDENGNYALLRQSQLPKDVPSGGVYDLPLDAYLRQKEWDKGKARRTHTMFARHVKDTDPSFLIRSESSTQDVVKGYRIGILTVSSLIAFHQNYPIGHVFDIHDADRDSVLGMIQRDTGYRMITN